MKKNLLVAAVLLASVAQAQELKQGSISNITRLTNDSEVMYDNPRWSPDGSKIAFTVDGSEGLFIMNPDGSEKKQISDASGVGYKYQWSADSREILVRDTRWENTVESQAIRRHALWSVDLTGKKIRLSEDAEYMQPGAWRYTVAGIKKVVAPDAKLVAQPQLTMLPRKSASRLAQLPENNISFYCDGDNLYKVDADGVKKLINQGPSFCAVLSPDGKRVAFNQMNNVVVMNIDGTSKTIIARGFNPCWVNNQQIVFEQTTDDGHDYLTGELYLATLDGGNIKKLTSTSNRIEMQPRVSPDGTKIVFCSYTDGQIYVADFK